MYFELDSELIDSFEAGLKLVFENKYNEDDLNYVIDFLQSAFSGLDAEKRAFFISNCNEFHEFKINFDKRKPRSLDEVFEGLDPIGSAKENPAQIKIEFS